MEPDDLKWLETPEPGCAKAELPFLALADTFVSGDPSGHRLNVRYYLRSADGVLRAKVLFGPGTQGPPGHAHGGSMAALLDEAMGGAAWLAGHPVVAAQLNIKFSRMLPLGTRCMVDTELVRLILQSTELKRCLEKRIIIRKMIFPMMITNVMFVGA